jgi:hypothetical protein
LRVARPRPPAPRQGGRSPATSRICEGRSQESKSASILRANVVGSYYAHRHGFEMLLALAQHGNFFTTWATLSVLTFVLMLMMSGTLFSRYYDRPTLPTRSPRW